MPMVANGSCGVALHDNDGDGEEADERKAESKQSRAKQKNTIRTPPFIYYYYLVLLYSHYYLMSSNYRNLEIPSTNQIRDLK